MDFLSVTHRVELSSIHAIAHTIYCTQHQAGASNWHTVSHLASGTTAPVWADQRIDHRYKPALVARNSRGAILEFTRKIFAFEFVFLSLFYTYLVKDRAMNRIHKCLIVEELYWKSSISKVCKLPAYDYGSPGVLGYYHAQINDKLICLHQLNRKYDY